MKAKLDLHINCICTLHDTFFLYKNCQSLKEESDNIRQMDKQTDR